MYWTFCRGGDETMKGHGCRQRRWMQHSRLNEMKDGMRGRVKRWRLRLVSMVTLSPSNGGRSTLLYFSKSTNRTLDTCSVTSKSTGLKILLEVFKYNPENVLVLKVNVLNAVKCPTTVILLYISLDYYSCIIVKTRFYCCSQLMWSSVLNYFGYKLILWIMN